MNKQPSPLGGRIPSEIHLPRAPVAIALAQVRFPVILTIATEEGVAPFQQAMREPYPFLSEDKVQSVQIGPAGPSALRTDSVWRFSSAKSDPEWRVSLAKDFVTIEAFKYTSRSDFLVRLRKVVNSVNKVFKPAEATRIGVRYVNRVRGEGFERLDELVRPEVLGVAGKAGSLSKSIVQTLTEVMLVTQEGHANCRWAVLPANTTYDPDVVRPIAEISWALDIDVFTASAIPFANDAVNDTATRFAERAYAVFRGLVTDQFLQFYGGKI